MNVKLMGFPREEEKKDMSSDEKCFEVEMERKWDEMRCWHNFTTQLNRLGA